MKRLTLLLILLLATLTALPAFALDLHQARNAGQIGEKTDGYVAVLKASPEVNALASEINTKRKEQYTKISKENGQTVEVVSKLAAQQIITNLQAGNLYQGKDGKWTQR